LRGGVIYSQSGIMGNEINSRQGLGQGGSFFLKKTGKSYQHSTYNILARYELTRDITPQPAIDLSGNLGSRRILNVKFVEKL
jgi:hypothetical protein